MFLSAPALYFALQTGRGEWFLFAVLFGFSCMMLYAYYATVYSAIQDVIEPSLRATAMALYFAAMYALGGAAGDPTIGFLSDRFAHSAAVADGVKLEGLDRTAVQTALEPFRAVGLNKAHLRLAHCVAAPRRQPVRRLPLGHRRHGQAAELDARNQPAASHGAADARKGADVSASHRRLGANAEKLGARPARRYHMAKL